MNYSSTLTYLDGMAPNSFWNRDVAEIDPYVRESMSRARRLLDPAWAIEYAAGNMHLAVKQPSFSDAWSNGYGGELTATEKMSGWYHRGSFNVKDPFVGSDVRFYAMDFVGTHKTAIKKLNLLHGN